jgi:hypothetical protein
MENKSTPRAVAREAGCGCLVLASLAAFTALALKNKKQKQNEK